MIGILAALAAGAGVYLLYTALVLGWRGLGPRRLGPASRRRSRDWLQEAGVSDVRVREFVAVILVVGLVGAVLGYGLFAAPLPAMVTGLCAAGFPLASYRARRTRRLAEAHEAWPRLLEELRLLTGSAGRSIPQALFEVGRRAPAELHDAFQAAERQWLLTTDFPRTLDVLKARLRNPTADAVCETLAVAQEVGGADLERRLAALIEDRVADLQGRKDAASKLAGVKFARLFVLFVPLGMALAGLSIGTGRSAYESPVGQVFVVVGLLSVAICWYWSGRLMRLPVEPRVFGEESNAVAGRIYRSEVRR